MNTTKTLQYIAICLNIVIIALLAGGDIRTTIVNQFPDATVDSTTIIVPTIIELDSLKKDTVELELPTN